MRLVQSVRASGPTRVVRSTKNLTNVMHLARHVLNAKQSVDLLLQANTEVGGLLLAPRVDRLLRISSDLDTLWVALVDQTADEGAKNHPIETVSTVLSAMKGS